MAKQKKTGFGTYITTLVVDSDLTATEARLFAFMRFMSITVPVFSI